MADLDGVVRIGTEIDDSGFIKGIERMNKSAENNLEPVEKEFKKIEESIESVGETSKKASENIKDIGDSSKGVGDTVGKEFEGATASAEDFAKAAENVAKVLQAKYEVAENKVSELTLALNQSVSKTGAASKESQELASDLAKAEKELSSVKNQLTKASKNTDEFSDELKDAEKEAKDFSSSIDKAGSGLSSFGSFLSASLIADGITSLVSGFADAVAESEEFTKSLSRLEINAETAGNSFDNIKDRFTDFIALTGQADSSAEALSNLLQTGFDDAGITQAVEALSGAVVQFPDTLNIESLADGLQETLATGTATGQFGELLDRLGIGADNFSEKLAKTTTEAEKQQLVLQTLADAGLNDVYQQYEEANSATLEFNKAQAELDMAMSNFVTGTLPYLGSGLGTVSDKILSLSESFKEGGFSALFDDLAGMAEGLPEKLAESFLGLQDTFIGLYDVINNALAENLPTMIESGLQFLVGFSGSLRENAGLLIDGALAMVQTIADGIIQNIPTIIETIPTIITNIAGIINDNAPKLIATAAKIILNLAIGLVKAIPTLVANIPKIIEAIVAVFLAFNWVNLGRNIVTSLKDGIASMAASVKTAASNIVSNINGTIAQLPAALKASGTNAIQALINGIKSLIGSVGGAIKQIATTILNGVKSLPSQFIEIGKNIIQGLINGVKNKVGDVGAAFTNLGSTIIDKTAHVLGINSPSRVFRDFIGKNIVLGLIEGVNALGEKVVIAITKPVQDAAKKIKNVGLAKNMTDVIQQATEKAKTEAKSYSDVGDILTEALQTSIDDNKEETIEKIQSLIDESLESIKDDDEKSKAKEAADELMKTYQEALEDGATKAKQYVSESISAITDEFQNQYDDLISKQQALEENLGGEYLFEVEDGEVFIEDLENSIDVLNRYQEALESLREKGATQDLIDQIATYEPEEGLSIMENLLKMSDDDFTEFQENWAEKKELARQIAEETYADQLTELKEGFIDEMTETLEKVPDDTFDIGVDSMQGWIDGMNNKLPDLEAKAREIARKVINAMKSEMGIASPSKEGIYMGEMVNAGVAKGLDDSASVVQNSIAKLGFFDAVKASIPQMQAAVTSAMSAMMPAPVYAMGGNNTTTNTYSYPFTISVDKVINSGQGSMEQFFEDGGFYAKKYARQKGGK